uniref:Cytochrome P450 n=1 Tax=Oryza glaberrima TaxID=4538 RepID=I1R6L1_ORYGL
MLFPLLCFLCLRHGSTRKQPRADGLKAYPIVGILPHFVRNQHRLLEWSAGVVARCPTHTMSFNFKGFGLIAGAITGNPANVEHIVKTNFQNYSKGEYVVSVMEDFLGHGIFNSDGDQWLWQRKAASYEFNKRSLRNFVVDTVRWRAKRLLDLEPERRMREALATIHGYADRIVRERRERGAAGLARKDDFLSRFAATGEHSDESLRDVVTNFVLAGRDTTSSALTWFFWLVSGQPDVEDRIAREIRAVRASSGSTDAAAFSFDELREMHYLHAAITEAMRLYPPVAMDSHCCQNDDVLPDGTFVGKGWQVTYSAYAMARLEELWGADCEEFRPERWLDEDGVFRPESPFKYPVFHGGPRMCLGKEMAYIQMKSIAACVFERFSFRFVGGEGRPGLVFSVTLRMEGGLPMRVKKRRDSVC